MLQQILGYKVPLNLLLLYLCNFSEENAQEVTETCIQTITKRWRKVAPSIKDQWLVITGRNLPNRKTDVHFETTRSTPRQNGTINESINRTA